MDRLRTRLASRYIAFWSRRERERLQCFSQPASLITYRRSQRSNVKNIKTVQNELENLHMILLCKKGSHGVCVRGKQRSIPLPNCLESWTLKNHVQFICNSHTTTMCADPIGSGNMLTPSKTPENNWQLMKNCLTGLEIASFVAQRASLSSRADND